MSLEQGRNDAAAEIRALDQRHVLHPWAHFASMEKDGALVVAKGQGCELTDANGKTYLDAVGGMWCTNIGLGREDMAKAIADQVMELAYCNTFGDMTNEPSTRLAARAVARARMMSSTNLEFLYASSVTYFSSGRLRTE